MKILYGVQGTGNGHISRASAMYEAFKDYPDLEITWLLSSRDREQGCGAISDFEWRSGITFVARDGRIQILPTLKKNNLLRFRQDVNSLELQGYDLVISDFEPVISHAARKRGVPVVGIGHQYAFEFDIPMSGRNPLVIALMRRYAPVTQPVGMHWHHFGHPILPPIVDIVIPEPMPPQVFDKVIVYLPFENPELVGSLCDANSNFDYYIYHPLVSDYDQRNKHWRSISRPGFKQDLLNAGSVITNSGFELISECLQMGGKRILTKPLQGQMEQLSNAVALQQLGFATILHSLDGNAISNWLESSGSVVKMDYPNVAQELAAWIAQGRPETVPELASRLWSRVTADGKPVPALQGQYKAA